MTELNTNPPIPSTVSSGHHHRLAKPEVREMIEIINEYERIIIKTDSSLDSAIDNESRISSTHYHTLDTKLMLH